MASMGFMAKNSILSVGVTRYLDNGQTMASVTWGSWIPEVA